jgi:hypothetical protein
MVSLLSRWRIRFNDDGGYQGTARTSPHFFSLKWLLPERKNPSLSKRRIRHSGGSPFEKGKILARVGDSVLG